MPIPGFVNTMPAGSFGGGNAFGAQTAAANANPYAQLPFQSQPSVMGYPTPGLPPQAQAMLPPQAMPNGLPPQAMGGMAPQYPQQPNVMGYPTPSLPPQAQATLPQQAMANLPPQAQQAMAMRDQMAGGRPQGFTPPGLQQLMARMQSNPQFMQRFGALRQFPGLLNGNLA